MRRNTFLSRIRILMAAGVLLLCVGIWRWLHAEYSSAEQELQRALFSEFMHAEMRMTDTILSQKVIAPMLSDSGNFKIELETDSAISINGKQGMMHVFTNSENLVTDDKIERVKTENDSIAFAFRTDSGDAMYQGIRLFITELRGPDGMHTMLERYISADDTLLLQKYFAENLDSAQLPVTPVWIHDALTNSFPPPAFTYHAKAFDMPFGAQITYYRSYLYKKLWPQGVFSLFLLLCIITAFLLAYRSLKKQMELSAIKDDLISNISHELKTPVATVRVAIEALRTMDKEDLHKTMPRYMQMAESELDRLEMLINKVMQSASLENGIPDMRIEVFDAVALLDTFIPGMITQAQMRNATLTYSGEVPHAQIAFDVVHFRGVLYNLIDNAIKYGGEGVHIDIKGKVEHGKYILQICDSGPGIPDAYADRIFEKFFRVPQGDTHNVKGHGLGLYYIAQVLHFGKADIRYAPNGKQGSCFTIIFDITKA
ncbi:MAG: HAMP domain-containing sensor histidine kinase [Chitinophagales bacterium]